MQLYQGPSCKLHELRNFNSCTGSPHRCEILHSHDHSRYSTNRQFSLVFKSRPRRVITKFWSSHPLAVGPLITESRGHRNEGSMNLTDIRCSKRSSLIVNERPQYLERLSRTPNCAFLREKWKNWRTRSQSHEEKFNAKISIGRPISA